MDTTRPLRDITFRRVGSGPILTPDDLPFHTDGVFNPGVAELDGEVVLLLRIEDRQGISQIRVARSGNGVDGWQVEGHPLLEPDLPDFPFEEWGCEDSRVTHMADGSFAIAYTAYSRYGPAVALATTQDFTSVERIGVVLSPTNKDAAVFPRSFQDTWLMLHRPVTGAQEHIWYASSTGGLGQWSLPGVLLPQRGGPYWDGMRVGVGAPPIETEEGWLLIYHGVKEAAGRPIYRLGLALLDRDNPRKVLRRASRWIFAPEAPYEQQGVAANIVYTCGALLRGDEVWMYYGAADTVVALATARLADLLAFVHRYDLLERLGRDKGMVGE